MSNQLALLLNFIHKNCPKGSTKDIEIVGRTSLGIQRRLDALRKNYPLGSDGKSTALGKDGGGGSKSPETDDAVEVPSTPLVEKKKRKTAASANPASGKKGTAKKIKKETVKSKVEDEADTLEADEDDLVI
jgi:hypothetical protein